MNSIFFRIITYKYSNITFCNISLFFRSKNLNETLIEINEYVKILNITNIIKESFSKLFGLLWNDITEKTKSFLDEEYGEYGYAN